MDALINPLALYVACALGALGVALALPTRGVSWRVPGGILAAGAGGLVVLLLSLRASERGQLPNVYFYVFAALALGSALRMISHPRPVYSALYFILTIIASSGVYVILAAEFMAFALIIIYAGAILITYLFVIMLATQAPVSGDEELLAEYDAEAREPMIASGVGFVLLAVLTTMMFNGLGALRPSGDPVAEEQRVLASLPLKVDRVLREAGLLEEGERVARVGGEGESLADIDLAHRTLVIENTETGQTRTLDAERWPEDLYATNAELLGKSLLVDHPGAIEIAGVILLMAMLGATVLSRRQVEIDEQAKAHEARRLHGTEASS